MRLIVQDANGTTCGRCHGPLPCDCWKTLLTPAERQAAQMVVVTRYLAVVDARAARKEFTCKHAAYPDPQHGRRGAFGNANHSSVTMRIRPRK